MDNLTTATPVEVDTALAEVYYQQARVAQQQEMAIDALHRQAGDKRSYGRRATWGMSLLDVLTKVQDQAEHDETYVGRQAKDVLARLDVVNAEAATLREEYDRLNGEWIRRGRWTRAYLVITSGKGHVHKDMYCSTCNRGGVSTAFSWLPQLSGHDEAEIIEKAGSDACTVCYPDAPVDVLSRPRSVWTEDEVKEQAAREQRVKDAEARKAKKIANGLTADGSEFQASYPTTLTRRVPVEHEGQVGYVNDTYEGVRNEYFKTERAAVQWVVQYVCWEGKDSAKRPAFDAIVEAVATKHDQSVEQVWADIDAKVIAKNKRDSRY